MLEDEVRKKMLAFEASLSGRLWRIIRDEEQIREVVQETYARLWRLPGQEICKITSIENYMFKVALNVAGQWRRREAAAPLIEWDHLRPSKYDISDPRQDVEAHVMAREELERVARVVMRMPIRQRQAVALLMFHQYTTSEVAVQMGITPSTARGLALRAIQRFGRAIERASGRGGWIRFLSKTSFMEGSGENEAKS